MQKGNSVRAAELRQGGLNARDQRFVRIGKRFVVPRRRFAAFEFSRNEFCDDLGVRVRLEVASLFDESLLQAAEILNDPVVHDRQSAVTAGLRMCILLGRRSVGCPSRVPDAGMTCHRVSRQRGDQLVDSADGLTRCDLAIRSPDRQARTVVSSILQATQSLDQELGGICRSDRANDSTHASVPLSLTCRDTSVHSDRTHPISNP